jgi:hypothetical protein
MCSDLSMGVQRSDSGGGDPVVGGEGAAIGEANAPVAHERAVGTGPRGTDSEIDDAAAAERDDLAAVANAVGVAVEPEGKAVEFAALEPTVAVVVEGVERSIAVLEERPPRGRAEELATRGDAALSRGVPDEDAGGGLHPRPRQAAAGAIEVERHVDVAGEHGLDARIARAGHGDDDGRDGAARGQGLEGGDGGLDDRGAHRRPVLGGHEAQVVVRGLE